MKMIPPFARAKLLSSVLTMLRYLVCMVLAAKFASFRNGFVRFGQVCLAVAFLAVGHVAAAQTVTTYTNSSNGPINSKATCTAPVVRDFTVTDIFVVGDVDLGVFVIHSWRGDLRMTLQHPDGTRVQLVNGDNSTISGDNFNVRLNDSETQTVNTDSATGTHSLTAPPPYANNFAPNAPLSAFNGKTSNGTWRLEICDLLPSAENGQFRRADLYLTSAPANYADLSLTKTVSNAAPAFGATITYTLTARNAANSTQTATGIVVRDILPPGVSFVTSSGAGSYDNGTGLWSVGTLAPGATATRTIEVTVTATAGATITNEAEVTESSRFDLDSTPDNGVTSEDDYAAASFTVAGTRAAGTPPILSCPNGSVLFDWSGKVWDQSDNDTSYALGALGNINFVLTNPGVWLNSATFGGQSPRVQAVMNGGFIADPDGLLQLVDLADQSAVVTTVVTLPRPMAGAQFRVFDVDFGANQFADRIVVTGELEGATIIPTLTNGVANYVIGNSAYGDGASNTDSADGNLVVTFSSPVDRIIIQYGNHSAAPANPGQQGIAIHDMTFCNLVTTLSVTKVSSVFTDPVNGSTNPKAIPGALVEYSFSVANPNAVSAQNVTLTDLLPGDITMCVASIGSAGPVVFTDGSPASGLTYTYTSLASGADDLEFTNNSGGSWTYTPVPDANGCDEAINGFRLIPDGTLSPSRSVNFKARFKIR